MTATRRTIKRPVRPVTLPGGDTVHVRGLSVAELRRVDARTEGIEDAADRGFTTTLLIAGLALVEGDGTQTFTGVTTDAKAEILDQVADLLTPDQLEAVFLAAAGRTKDEQKN